MSKSQVSDFFFQPTEECCLHHNEAVYDQDQDRKVERDESVGNVTAVVGLPAPEAGAVSKTLKSPQSLHSPGVMYRITTVKVTAILDFSLFTKGDSLSGGKLYVVSFKRMCYFEQTSLNDVPLGGNIHVQCWTRVKKMPTSDFCRQLCGRKHSVQPQ